MSLRELEDSLREMEVEAASGRDHDDEQEPAADGYCLDQLAALVEAEASEESLEEDTEWLRNVRTSALMDAAAEAELLPALVASASEGEDGSEHELCFLAEEAEEDESSPRLEARDIFGLLEPDRGEGCGGPREAASPTSVISYALSAEEELLILSGSVYDALRSSPNLLALPAPPATQPASPLPPPATAARADRKLPDRKEWSAAEDETILQSVQAFGCKWRRIAALLPGRSDDSVRNRWSRMQQSAAAAVPNMGGGGEVVATPKPLLAAVPRSKAPNADGKPERTAWTADEDGTILCGVAELGHKWARLAPRLPGRTEHAIRNRYHRLQAMHADAQLPIAAAVPIPVV